MSEKYKIGGGIFIVLLVLSAVMYIAWMSLETSSEGSIEMQGHALDMPWDFALPVLDHQHVTRDGFYYVQYTDEASYMISPSLGESVVLPETVDLYRMTKTEDDSAHNLVDGQYLALEEIVSLGSFETETRETLSRAELNALLMSTSVDKQDILDANPDLVLYDLVMDETSVMYRIIDEETHRYAVPYLVIAVSGDHPVDVPSAFYLPLIVTHEQ